MSQNVVADNSEHVQNTCSIQYVSSVKAKACSVLDPLNPLDTYVCLRFSVLKLIHTHTAVCPLTISCRHKSQWFYLNFDYTVRPCLTHKKSCDGTALARTVRPAIASKLNAQGHSPACVNRPDDDRDFAV